YAPGTGTPEAGGPSARDMLAIVRGLTGIDFVGFDVDAESPILFEHPESAAWLDTMSHQAYGARTGIARLLRVLDRRRIRGTFFIPGYSAERWPAICRAIRDAGHEIAHHGYLHETAHGASPVEEEARIVRGLASLDEVLGVRPAGHRGPNWELTFETPALLAKHGFIYDSGLMDADHPYVLATSAQPDAPTLIELPGHWALDDWEPYNYLPGITGSGVISSPLDVLARWTLELEALVEEGGLFMLTNHPFVSGRASRAVALETLIERAQAIDGLWIATGEEISAHVASLDLAPVSHRRPVLPP
ncbi:MAG: polysaccharide deacetylase family protein, partial [Chloroflexi bacterium]|nr:polysaccharide deacetylase family protein [Chloroflexota bacterium]